ncbi:MAG: type IVB secretion system lipoprotein DotD [Gammaproteobacteria bacterium]|nr:type IVB secretion system lipoprotein DotD [Gammaproteobacteria bacterium]
MKIKFLWVVTSFFILSACATPPAPYSGPTNADRSLAEATYSVSRSLVTLSEVAQAAHPLPALEPPDNPASYGMGGNTSVDWSGPVEPLIKQIANTTNYRLTIIGSPPAIPVLVTIYSRNVPIADILRDVGYQCGRRATVVVYPGNREIELRYAKN